MLLRLSDERREYEFGEEDFCYFQHLPHGRLVFPIIESKDNLACSCTVLWLIKDFVWIQQVEPQADQAELLELVVTSSVKGCWESGNFSQMVESCGFDAKLDECKAFTGTKRTTTTTARPGGSTVKNNLQDDLESERTKTKNLGIAVGALAVFCVLVLVGFIFLAKRYRSLKISASRSEALSFSPLK